MEAGIPEVRSLNSEYRIQNTELGAREPAKSFRDLVVWQKAHQLVLETYKITQKFPVNETYGLISQTRRAAVSVPANIAEGFKKRGPADKRRFLNIAQGSLEELRYYFILAQNLGYCQCDNAKECVREVSKLLEGCILPRF